MRKTADWINEKYGLDSNWEVWVMDASYPYSKVSLDQLAEDSPLMEVTEASQIVEDSSVFAPVQGGFLIMIYNTETDKFKTLFIPDDSPKEIMKAGRVK